MSSDDYEDEFENYFSDSNLSDVFEDDDKTPTDIKDSRTTYKPETTLDSHNKTESPESIVKLDSNPSA